MQKLLSIVVPVYKVEPYINKCLDSCILYRQDAQGNRVIDEDLMSQLEVIIVNDGTPDRSAEMSHEYTIRYPQNFRQIDKENGGHGSAWNVGLREATGKYLRFLDSDDWLTNLDKLMEKLANTEADLVFTDYVRVDEPTRREEYRCVNSRTDITLELTTDMLFQQKEGLFVLNFWHTTYKTAILQPQYPLFEEHVMYDDSILSLAPLLYGRTYIYFNMPVYQYLVGRQGQSMNPKIMAKNIHSYFRCYERLVRWRDEAFKVGLPAEYQKCVEMSVQHYAKLVFSHLTYLPYSEAKTYMPLYYMEGYSSKGTSKSKMVKRYEKLPFCLFYLLEQIRNLKNT